MCGVALGSLLGLEKKWFIIFIDDYTRLCWVYLMNEKSEVKNMFQVFYKMVENQFQSKICLFQFDNGKEYFNEHLRNFFFEEKGILHRSTCRDTSQQNGIAKRKNKHSLEVARAIMFSMHILKYLWGEAILTSSF